MNIFIATRWILCISIFLILSTSACEDDEISEASEAFRNCAGSSEATMYERVREEKDEDRPTKICTILDSLYSGCKLQKSTLEKCKGVEHVSKLIEIRLYSIHEVLKYTYSYQNIDVASCNIFKKEKVTSKRPLTTTLRPNVKTTRKRNQDNSIKDREQYSKGNSQDNGSAGSKFVPNSLLIYVIILSLRHFWFF